MMVVSASTEAHQSGLFAPAAALQSCGLQNIEFNAKMKVSESDFHSKSKIQIVSCSRVLPDGVLANFEVECLRFLKNNRIFAVF